MQKRTIDPKIKARALKLLERGKRPKEIADELGLPRTTVSTWASRAAAQRAEDVTPPPAPPTPEAPIETPPPAPSTPAALEQTGRDLLARSVAHTDVYRHLCNLGWKGKPATVKAWAREITPAAVDAAPPVLETSSPTSPTPAAPVAEVPIQAAPPPADIEAPRPLDVQSTPAADIAPADRHQASRPLDVQASMGESIETLTPAAVAQVNGHPGAQTSRKVLVRKDGRELRRTTVYLQPDLARWLAVRAAETERDQSEIINEALVALRGAAPAGG